MSKNLSFLFGRKGIEHNLFEKLGDMAQKTGTPEWQEAEKLKDEFLVGKANIYGTISFYDFLKEENRGKKIYVCNGSSCLTAKTQQKVKEKLGKYFRDEEIGEMCCLGRCHENSSFHYNGRNYSGASIDHLDEILESCQPRPDQYHVQSGGNAVLSAPYPNIKEYYSILQKALEYGVDYCLGELKKSGLRGRGGAGFPIALKLESCKNSRGDTKFVVCNADEGDPGAYSDRYLLEQRPHAVLLGMMIAGYIVGAKWGVLYIRAEYPESIKVIEEAIDHLKSLGWVGENIFNTNFNFHFKIIKARGAYICGEETALLSSIEGQRPEVRVRPPYPTQQGLFNQPTVVNNVETLAAIPYVIQHGGENYASIGTARSTGTKLISLDGFFNRPGIYEVEMGTPLKQVVYDLGGGFRCEVKAMHIGGPLGGLVPVSKIDELTVDFESFNKGGFLLGHASVVCIPADYPLVEYIKHLFQFTAHESCGKCFPCRIGSTRGYEMFEKALNSDYKIDRQLLDDLLETLEVGSLCALGGGLPLPIKNALEYFYDELSAYFKK